MAPDLRTSFESPQVEARAPVIYVGGFIAFVGVSLVLLRVFLIDWAANRPAPPPRPAPEPRLETHSGQTLAAIERAEREKASAYAWVDRSNGRVRIPIARALQLILARGSSAYEPLPQPKPQSPSAPP